MEKQTWIGLIASSLTTVAAVPQLYKIIKKKTAENISLVWIAILICGLCIWAVYGVLKKDAIIIASNVIAVAINTAIAFFALKYRKKQPSLPRV